MKITKTNTAAGTSSKKKSSATHTHESFQSLLATQINREENVATPQQEQHSQHQQPPHSPDIATCLTCLENVFAQIEGQTENYDEIDGALKGLRHALHTSAVEDLQDADTILAVEEKRVARLSQKNKMM